MAEIILGIESSCDDTSAAVIKDGYLLSNVLASQDVHKAHMYGNIGVTTSASMLSEFYNISKWSLLEHICDVFISELLIPVY